jgi:hypothetical protein
MQEKNAISLEMDVRREVKRVAQTGERNGRVP